MGAAPRSRPGTVGSASRPVERSSAVRCVWIASCLAGTAGPEHADAKNAAALDALQHAIAVPFAKACPGVREAILVNGRGRKLVKIEAAAPVEAATVPTAPGPSPRALPSVSAGQPQITTAETQLPAARPHTPPPVSPRPFCPRAAACSALPAPAKLRGSATSY